MKDTEAMEGWPRGQFCQEANTPLQSLCWVGLSLPMGNEKLGDDVAFCIGDANPMICL